MIDYDLSTMVVHRCTHPYHKSPYYFDKKYYCI